MTELMRVGLGLGSNLGDRLANLRSAREHVTALPGCAPTVLSAPLFETEPVDCPSRRRRFSQHGG